MLLCWRSDHGTVPPAFLKQPQWRFGTANARSFIDAATYSHRNSTAWDRTFMGWRSQCNDPPHHHHHHDAKDHDSGSSQNKVFKPNMVKIIRFWDRGPFDSATITNHTRKIKISETGESKSRKREKKKTKAPDSEKVTMKSWKEETGKGYNHGSVRVTELQDWWQHLSSNHTFTFSEDPDDSDSQTSESSASCTRTHHSGRSRPEKYGFHKHHLSVHTHFIITFPDKYKDTFRIHMVLLQKHTADGNTPTTVWKCWKFPCSLRTRLLHTWLQTWERSSGRCWSRPMRSCLQVKSNILIFHDWPLFRKDMFKKTKKKKNWDKMANHVDNKLPVVILFPTALCASLFVRRSFAGLWWIDVFSFIV